jgi:hypothetical protein
MPTLLGLGTIRGSGPLDTASSRRAFRISEAVGQWLIGLTEVTVDQSGKSDMVDGEVADTAV